MAKIGAQASRWLQGGARAVSGVLFLCLFAVFMIQITARFVNQPLPWTDELAVILYIWVIVWTAALVVPEREHVVFDMVWNAAGRRSRQMMVITGNLLVGGLALVGMPATWDYVHGMRREGTPVWELPLMWVFLPLVLLMAALVVRSTWAIWQALQGHGLDSELRL